MQLLGFERRDFVLGFNLFKLSLSDRYLGSTLGLIWAIVNPVLMLGIFTFVFGFVFKSKLPGAETSMSYVIWLISGYAPWLGISEGLASGTSSVVANSGVVKNLAFKTELLPIQGALMGCIPLAVGLTFLVVLLAIDGRAPTLSWVMIPFAIIMQFVFVAGISFFLSALNVFVRDVGVALTNLLIVLLFLTPIFYPITAFPGAMRVIAEFNPFYVLSEAYRLPLLEGRIPSAWQLIYVIGVSTITFVLGLAFFRRLKNYFDARL
ncbi:MAG TPA: ABC transporter permease [Gammaproteobacteria bacterium]|nr:ABC transporter permease [Gammaproteobacteria bacterium]